MNKNLPFEKTTPFSRFFFRLVFWEGEFFEEKRGKGFHRFVFWGGGGFLCIIIHSLFINQAFL